MLEIPYYKQEEDYTCGPTAVKMVLGFYGVKESVENLKNKCHVSETKGTTRANMIKVLKNFGLHVHAHADASLEEVGELLKKRKAVVVNFREPSSNEGHYAVVRGFKGGKIFLRDPYNGADFSIKTKEFIARWFGYHKSINKNWIMAVSQEKFTKLIFCRN